MENKVIIGLDEYLDLRDRAQKVDALKYIGKVIDEDERFFSHQHGCWEVKITREVVIRSEDLTKYINDILGVSGFEVRILMEDNK